MVVGAGRGPLVRAALRAAKSVGIVDIYIYISFNYIFPPLLPLSLKIETETVCMS